MLLGLPSMCTSGLPIASIQTALRGAIWRYHSSSRKHPGTTPTGSQKYSSQTERRIEKEETSKAEGQLGLVASYP